MIKKIIIFIFFKDCLILEKEKTARKNSYRDVSSGQMFIVERY